MVEVVTIDLQDGLVLSQPQVMGFVIDLLQRLGDHRQGLRLGLPLGEHLGYGLPALKEKSYQH
jgi:hypothetical protein